jgi:uncharacterized RDD family membrane protein YckC
MPSVPNSGPAAPPPPPVWDATPSGTVGARYAGFWLRAVAALIDGIAFIVIWEILSFFLPMQRTDLTPPPPDSTLEVQIAYLRAFMDSPAPTLPTLVGAVVAWAYFVFQETSKAQATLGKRVLGIRVSREDGSRLSLGAATLRVWPMYLHNLVWLVSGWLSSLVLFLAFIACIAVAFSSRKQGLHDKMAGALLTRN